MEGVEKILLLSSGDTNGAYEAIYRIGKYFKDNGHEVAMLVKNKKKQDDFIIQYNYQQKTSILSRLILKIKKKVQKRKDKVITPYDPEYNFISEDESKENVSVDQIIKQIGFIPNVVYSGMTDYFMNSTDLLNIYKKTSAQIYTIAVDMNHFTGGCHYAWDCKGYIKGCDIDCPAILDQNKKTLAKQNFELKFKNASEANFKNIGMSQWTVNQAKESKIYKNQDKINNINSIIDTDVLNDSCKEFAKKIFNLESDKFYILMGSQNVNHTRKGFEYLLKALQILYAKLPENKRSKIEVLIVSRQVTDSFSEIPFNKKHIDYINDYRLLALLYQSADVFVNSSIEDSGPMMVSEALACGTPVVGFNMGVVSNMVVNDYNGYIAKLKDTDDLAIGIEKIINLSDKEYKEYSKNAVKQVLEYSSLNSLKILTVD